eukprot:SM000437S15696  [mRNA]  locus=s437:30223:32473:- [translate_table: standard]
MSFFTAILFGIVAGILLCYLWKLRMDARNAARTARAADLAALAAMDSLQLRALCGDAVPSWINFPEFERVNWLNVELREIWPFVNRAASELIKAVVEPMLLQYRPIGVSSLKFAKLTLGTMAPQIGGVRLTTKEGLVTMDVDFKWGGNPSIVLAIRTLALAALRVQLKDLKFFATMRLIFRLSETLPCVAAVVSSILATPKPVISYTLKAVGGSVKAVPGLGNMVDDLIWGSINDILVWPHRIVTPIVPGDYKSLELGLQGCLTVTVIGAKGLRNADFIGKSDPLVILFVRTKFQVRTRTINNSLHPTWDETFELNVEDHETQRLVLRVFDEDLLGGDALLGVAAVQLLYHAFTQEEEAAAIQREKEAIKSKQEGAKVAPPGGSAIEGVQGGAAKKPGGFVGTITGAVHRRKGEAGSPGASVVPTAGTGDLGPPAKSPTHRSPLHLFHRDKTSSHSS